MQYSEHQPHPLLAPYVKCIWTLEGRGAVADNNSFDKILPDGCTELIFHYGDQYQQLYSDGRCDKQERSFVYGQLTEHIKIGATGDTGIIAVRFFPFGLSGFTATPVYQLTQSRVSITDLWASAAHDLEWQVIEAGNNRARLRLINSFLVSQLLPPTDKQRTLSAAVAQIDLLHGDLRVSTLARSLHISERTLERMFITSVGMSAKTYARISRLHHALQLMQASRVTSLTDLAYETGYYDQAHFIRDFKDIAGESPSQYFSADNAMGSFFIGAE